MPTKRFVVKEKYFSERHLGKNPPTSSSCKTLWVSLKTKMVCEYQRLDHPTWYKIVLLNFVSGDQNPLKKRGEIEKPNE
jgi:hypothetical protein